MMQNLFRKVLGSPYRFFGFFTLLNASYFSLLFFLDGFVLYYGLCFGILLTLGLLLYLIAKQTKDLEFGQSSSSCLFGSPVKVIAFIVTLYGYMSLFLLLAWKKIDPPLFLTPFIVGVLLYVIDYLIRQKTKQNKRYLRLQSLVVLIVLCAFFLRYKRAKAHTNFILPDNVRQEVIIVFGIEEYPELPNSFLWKKEIHIPENGLLVTSSSFIDLPGYRKNFLSEDGAPIQMTSTLIKDVFRDSDTLLYSYYLTPDGYYPFIPFDQSDLQRNYQKLYDSVRLGQLTSKYLDERDDYYRREKPRDELYLEFLENTVKHNQE